MKKRNIFQLSISILILYFLLSPFEILSQEKVGRPTITNYKYQDYGANPTNWWIIEGDDGIMYFANGAGVLVYDGVNWSVVTLTNQVSPRSFAKDSNGRIYLSAEGDFGYLETNPKGELYFISLKNNVPEEHRDFATVWDCDIIDDKVVFRTTDKSFIWDGENIDVLIPKNNFHQSAQVNGVNYVRVWNEGLCTYKDGITQLVPGGELFANERVYLMLPYDDTRMLLGTRTMGFFIYDGNTFEPFKTEIDEFIKGSIYLPGIALDNGNFIVNSFSNGAYLIDHNGKLIQSFTPGNGLQDGSVTYTYLDSRGILWLGLFNGISRVDLNSPLTFLDTNMGLETNVVWDTVKFNDLLYVGTNDGIFYLDEDRNTFKRIEGTTGQTYLFKIINDRLYSGSGDIGFFELKDKTIEFVRKSINYDFRFQYVFVSEFDPNRIFVIFQEGIQSFYYNNSTEQFEEESKIITVTPQVVNIKEQSKDEFWFTSLKNGTILRIYPKFNGEQMDLANAEIKEYTQANGLPDNPVVFVDLLDETYVLSPNGTFLFNPETERFTQGDNPFGDFTDLGSFTYPIEDTDGKIFYHTNDGLNVAFKNGQGDVVVNSEAFRDLKNWTIFSIRPEPPKPNGNQIIWIAGTDGIIRYEGNLESTMISNFNTKIRNISIAGDSLIYGGAGNLPKNIDLKSGDNTITFNYAAPLFKSQNNVEYSTYLKGFDDKWSDWTKQTSREYINLPPGNYTFSAKAKSLYGHVTPEISVPFSVETPWYKQWWAYILYAIGFLLLIYLIVNRRTKILKIRQKLLEESVEARTKEVKQRMEELATVNAVSQALTEKLQLKELIKMVGDEMKKLFKSDITYLAILDRDTNIISFPYQDGDNMAPLNYGEGLTSKIIKTGEPLLINKNTDIDAEYDKMGVKTVGLGAVSYLGVPIPSEDNIIGVLSVQSTQQENRFSEEDKRLLSTIATNVGIAIHNAELYEEAKQAKARAEDANEAKSAFLSTVSHELRTPLTSVLGFAKIIRKRLEDKIFPEVNVEDQKMKRTMKQVSENLDVVVSEGERLTTLINDVLDLAKIESGKMEWNMKPIFLQDAISRAVSSTSSLFEQKGISLKKNIPSDLPLVKADEDKLIQVVINLLSNAVKFTDKGKVTIEAYSEKDQIIVEVQDTGIGIAEKDKNKVFEKFRQAGDTLTDKPKGTGLGLPICREIIEHHGGIIWMKSEPGVGSTFFFSIPTLGENMDQPPMQLERILKSLKQQIKHSSLNTDILDKPTILVVDDDTPIRSLLRQELSEAGFNVTEAANGKAALDMVRNSKPDLIILDVMMPEINGFDVAAVLKNDPATMDIPIIILSIVQDKERGLRIGVDRYLTKPINTEQLFHEVDVLLEQGVSKKKVMIVDQNISAVKSLSDVLSARGYKVMESNPDNLFESASESQPDIIMLNSVFNGDKELIKKLKLQKGMENVMFFIYE
ncbi:ATP-binding protein [Aegicerativicinus sediminis]|uniref:ATP-binding protein n=1 Tax=Aegicerativicinus sediminis TaxID=2893202 RepID=UPI001E4996C8|nr:ATP-binding protein [Aegicerativicinus sediminis]